MSKWLMIAVLVLLVLTAAVGFRSFAAGSWDSGIHAVNSSPITLVPTGMPPPPYPPKP
jgi:hypothetical protein